MSNIVIQAYAVGKQYKLGGAPAHNTLRDAIVAGTRRLLARPGTAKPHPRGDEKSFWALKDVSFDIRQGEVVGLVGRNGAGKSTLLKILSRITEPTRGKVQLRGRVGSLLEVGTGFHPELSGRENVFLSGAILGMRRGEILEKYDEIIAFSELERFADTPVKHYSSGMYMRLAFAVAAHLDPEILMIDEVLAVGDAAFQKKCLGKMEDVAHAGRTVILVSHNMVAIESLCTRCLWIESGQLMESGPATEVVNHYLKRRVGRHVGGHNRQWGTDSPAPASESVRLLSARVTTPSDNEASTFTIDLPLQLEVHFQLLKDVAGFSAGMHVVTPRDETAFVTTSKTMDVKAGEYRTTCHFPANLFNARTYLFQFYFIKDATEVLLHIDDMLSVDLNDIPRVNSWLGPIPGLVRPKLDWSLAGALSTTTVQESSGQRQAELNSGDLKQ